MASEQDDTVFPEEELDDDDDEESQGDEEEEEEEDDDDDVLGDDEENEASPSTSSALAVTVAVPGSAISNGGHAPITTATATTIVVGDDSSDPKRQRVEQIEEKKPLDDSRRLFQRLWTDEDEIELLQGFLDYTSQRGSSHHNDTAFFYDQIKSKLQLDFNKNQLVEKIRRLKKKYRNVLNKIGSGKEFTFKSAHDQATFEISRKIWSNMGPIGGAVEDNALDDDEINLNSNLNLNPNPNFSLSTPRNEVMIGNSAEKRTPSSLRKRSRPRSGVTTDEKRESNNGSASNRDHNCVSNTTTTTAPPPHLPPHNSNSNFNSGLSIPNLIEETVRTCLSPLLKELLSGAMGGPFGAARGFAGFSLNPLPLSFGGASVMNFGSGEVMDDKWRKQQILELEVYSKRLELVQDQIKAALEELRSAGG